MKRSGAVLAVVAVLAVGLVIGSLATHLYYAQRLRGEGSSATMASRFFAHRLDRELDLSAEQRAAIGEILDETREEANSLRGELRPRVASLMRDAAEHISEVLTPEQRERFADLQRRHRGRAEHFFLGPPGPHGPHRHGPPPWWERGRFEDRPPPEPPAEREAPDGS